MKKQKSLLYRMWKISSSKIILSALVYILLCFFMFLPFLFELLDENPGGLAREFEKIMNSGELVSFADSFGNSFFLFIPIFVGVGLLFASGILGSDLKVGWNRYVITLPISASENARAYVMLHFFFFAGFEIITFVYGILIGHLIHVSCFCGAAMNLLAILTAAAMAFDAMANLILVSFWERKDAEQIIIAISFILVGIVFCSFMATGGKGMVDVRALLMFSGSIKGAILSAGTMLAGICISYFIMRRLYERRPA